VKDLEEMDKHRAELPGKICDAVLKKILPQMSQLHDDQIAMNTSMMENMEAVEAVDTRLKSFDSVISEERESAIRVQQQQAGVLHHIKVTQQQCAAMESKIDGLEDEISGVKGGHAENEKQVKQLHRASAAHIKDQEMQERVAAARFREQKAEGEGLQLKIGDEMQRVMKSVESLKKRQVDLNDSMPVVEGGLTGRMVRKLDELTAKVAGMEGPMMSELQNYREENRAVLGELDRHQQLYRTTQSDFQEVLEEVRMVSTAALSGVGMDMVCESAVGKGGTVTGGDGGLVSGAFDGGSFGMLHPPVPPAPMGPGASTQSTAGSVGCRPETSPDRRGRRPDSQPNREGFFLPQPRQPITTQARKKQQRVQRGRFFLKTAPADAPTSGPGYRMPTEGGVSNNNSNNNCNRIIVSRGGSAGGSKRRPRTDPGPKRCNTAGCNTAGSTLGNNFEPRYEHFPAPASTGGSAGGNAVGGGNTGGGGIAGGQLDNIRRQRQQKQKQKQKQQDAEEEQQREAAEGQSRRQQSLVAVGGAQGTDMLTLPNTSVAESSRERLLDWWREDDGESKVAAAAVEGGGGAAQGVKSMKAKQRPVAADNAIALPPATAR
jgi:hypothetical protein